MLVVVSRDDRPAWTDVPTWADDEDGPTRLTWPGPSAESRWKSRRLTTAQGGAPPLFWRLSNGGYLFETPVL